MPGQEQVRNLLETIRADTAVPDAIKRQAEETLNRGPIYQSDLWIYRAVVVVLGLTVIITVVGGLGLAYLGSPQNYRIPPELIALGSAAVGALAGLLAPSPREGKTSA